MFEHPEVRKAAGAYRRVLIRVPEAYLLLAPYGCKRPGLLVIDADGRRVNALPLAPVLADEMQPEHVANWLTNMLKAPVRDRVRFRIRKGTEEQIEKLLGAYRKLYGAEALSRDGDTIALDAPLGKRMDAVAALPTSARSAGVQVEILSPVRVELTPAEPEAQLPGLLALHSVPGVLTTDAAQPAVFMPRLLLHPAPLRAAAPKLRVEAKAVVYEFEHISKGAAGAPVARAPLGVAGVLSVFPDVVEDEITVVMRPDTDDTAVRLAFEAAGAKPEPAADDD